MEPFGDQRFTPKMVKLMRHYGLVPTMTGGGIHCYATSMRHNTEIHIWRLKGDTPDGPPTTETDPILMEIVTVSDSRSPKFYRETLMEIKFESVQKFVESLSYLPQQDQNREKA